MLLLGFSLLLQWWSIVFLLSLYTVILLFGNMHSYNYGNAGLKWKAAGFENSAYNSLSAAAAKLLQSCLTLCNLIDGSPPGSAVPGILQARTLEWVAISFSSACKWKVKVKSLSCVQLLATPWTAAYQAPLSMGFSRQEYWSGVPLPSPIIHFSINFELLYLQLLCFVSFVIKIKYIFSIKFLGHISSFGFYRKMVPACSVTTSTEWKNEELLLSWTVGLANKSISV